MRNFNFVVVVLSLVLAGCNGSLATGDAVDATVSPNKTLQGGCSVQQSGSIAVITCSDGTHASISGVTPQYQVKSGGLAIGRLTSAAGGTWHVTKDSENMHTTYGTAGMQPAQLYYTDASCASAPVQGSYSLPNLVFRNGTERFTAGPLSSVLSSQVVAMRTYEGNCIAVDITYYTEPLYGVIPYSGSLPVSIPVPSLDSN
jgi:predicted small secreted protein